MEGHEEPILSMALVKSVNQVVSASFDQTLRLWSLESGECIATLKGHTEKVYSVQAISSSVYTDGEKILAITTECES